MVVWCHFPARVAVILAALLVSSLASANPLIGEGQRLCENGEFDRAIGVLAEAVASGDLTRDELVALLETRILSYHALRNDSAAELDLRRLASLEPGHAFRPETPPEINQLFAEVDTGRPVLLHVRPERDADRIRIAASIRNDSTRLVSNITIWARTEGSDWARSEGEPLEIAGQPSVAVEYYAVAIGLGGAPIAALGTETRPILLEPVASGSAAPRRRLSRSPWFWMAVGVLVVGAAVTTGIVAPGGSASDQTRPSRPSVIGW